MSNDFSNAAENNEATEEHCLRLIGEIRNEVQLLLLNGHLNEEQKAEILRDVIGLLGGLN